MPDGFEQPPVVEPIHPLQGGVGATTTHPVGNRGSDPFRIDGQSGTFVSQEEEASAKNCACRVAPPASLGQEHGHLNVELDGASEQ